MQSPICTVTIRRQVGEEKVKLNKCDEDLTTKRFKFVQGIVYHEAGPGTWRQTARELMKRERGCALSTTEKVIYKNGDTTCLTRANLTVVKTRPSKAATPKAKAKAPVKVTEMSIDIGGGMRIVRAVESEKEAEEWQNEVWLLKGTVFRC